MLVIVVVFSKIIVMFKNNKGEKMHKVEKNIIKVKKFDTFKEAYQYQKTLTGSNFFEGF